MVMPLALSFSAKAQIKADFTSSPQSGCAPLIVSFTNVSSGSADSWKWDLGGGVTSTEQNPATSYFDPGVYTVKLIIYKGGATDTIVKTGYITVYDNPVAAFGVSDSTGCFPLNILYTDKSKAGSGAITTRTWDFGDGNFSALQQPSHSYTAAGTFSVTLSITNTYGCTSSFARQNLVHVSDGVHAGYTVTEGAICHSPANFNFNSTATGGGNLSYAWNFGDGKKYTQAQLSHSYKTAGNYNVSLKVTSSAGCADSITKPLAVAFVKSQIAVNDTICVNTQVQFINASSPGPASSAWSFGDRTTSGTISPAKAYSAAGLYKVTLINTFFAGCIDSISKKVRVVPAAAASFQTSDTAGCSLPFTAHFKNTSAAAGLSFVWDFGDGTKSSDKNPVHNYDTFGTYTVTLKAINGGGCETIVTKTNFVTVQPLKIVSVNGVTSGCIPYKITPSLQTSSPVAITKYSWDFGDGTTSASSTPSHTYTKEGIYAVKVTIETASGCIDSLTRPDSAGHKLNPSFTIQPASVCASQEVAFNNTTKEESSFLWWYLGDGTIVYKQPSPAHNYSDTGTYNVMLVVEENGCLDSIIKKKAVHIAGPVAKFSSKNDCANPYTKAFSNTSVQDVTRKWDFGDGGSDTSRNPVHLFKSTGAYDVKLFVSNGTCSFITDTIVHVVDEKGVLQVSDSIICRNTKLNFKVNNVNAKNIASVAWNFTAANNIVTGTDGLNGTTGSYNYNVTGIYKPYAIVTDILGCTDTLLTNKIVVFGPTAQFKPIETGACKNGSIDFKDTSTTDGAHPIASWVLNYGDNTSGTYAARGSFGHTYTDTGLYTIKMVVTDNYGCADTAQQVNAVLITRPYASFKISDTVVCPGTKVTFNNTAKGYIKDFSWKMGDGVNANGTSVWHLYTTQGTYTPTLYVTDINACIDSISIPNAVRVFTPSAKFLMSDSFSACPPLSVTFTNQGADFAGYQWNFGDGNTSTVASPAHIYTYPGVYPVKLVLSGNGGCADSLVKTITIKGPTGSLQYVKSAACSPSSLKLKAVSQDAVQYLWDYSDGNTSLNGNDTSSHLYAPGFYVPRIILIDKNGCKVPVRGVDTVKVYGITAGASVSNYLLCDSGKVVFTDSSVTNDVIRSSTWMFDGNTTTAGSVVTHSYTNAGSYHVRLVDVTANGCTDTLNLPLPIKIGQSPAIRISGATSFCQPATISLQAKNTNNDTSAVTWNWDFGGGITSTAQNPSGIIVANAGNYPVSVTAKNSSGCTATATSAVAVHALPSVKAAADTTTICKASTVSLQATGAAEYVWKAAQSISCTNCSNPVAKPDSTSLYRVTGKDGFGCTATDSILVNVSQPVHISVTAKSDTLCHGETKQLTAAGAKTYQWFPSIYLSDASTAQPVFNAAADTAITYKVTGYDENRCFTDTATIRVKVYPIPQMQLVQSNISAPSGSKFRLSTINSADVTKWKWTPALWLDNPNVPSPVAQPRENITYTVVAANDGACVTRAQVDVIVTCNGGNIFVPNTFSPNGDGANDVFYPRGTGLYNIKSFRVFNRWGQQVFEKVNTAANNAADGWDGTLNGQKLPSGVYVYIIEVLCTNNMLVPVKGNITLLR